MPVGEQIDGFRRLRRTLRNRSDGPIIALTTLVLRKLDLAAGMNSVDPDHSEWPLCATSGQSGFP